MSGASDVAQSRFPVWVIRDPVNGVIGTALSLELSQRALDQWLRTSDEWIVVEHVVSSWVQWKGASSMMRVQ